MPLLPPFASAQCYLRWTIMKMKKQLPFTYDISKDSCMKFKDKLCQFKRGLAQITDIVSVRFLSYLYQQHMWYCIDIIQNLSIQTVTKLCQWSSLYMNVVISFFNRKVILILVQYLFWWCRTNLQWGSLVLFWL